MNKSESIKAIAAALCNFQNEVGKIKKGETNPFFKSKYASLADILDVIQKPLSSNELAFVQFPEGDHQLTTMLMHTSGEWISATYSMTPAKNDPQGLGSVITYQRRYALGAVLGLNIDDDDDGNAASTPQKPDQNYNGMKTKKPLLPDARFNKALMLYKDGDSSVYTTLISNFELTKEQIIEWDKEVNKWNAEMKTAINK